jgi:flagellar assembly protein FliH
MRAPIGSRARGVAGSEARAIVAELTHPLAGARLFSVEEERTQALAEAREAGFREGFDAGVASLREETDAARSALARFRDETLRGLREKETALAEEVERMLPFLALEVARRVVTGVEFDAEAIKVRVAEVLAEAAPADEDVEVRLSPADLALIGEGTEELCERHPRLKFSADPALGDGDCVLRGRFGLADARLKTRWKAVADLLTG